MFVGSPLHVALGRFRGRPLTTSSTAPFFLTRRHVTIRLLNTLFLFSIFSYSTLDLLSTPDLFTSLSFL